MGQKASKHTTILPSNDLLNYPIKSEEIPLASPTLVAWSSCKENKIRIAEIESKEEFANFDGAQLRAGGSWPVVKEIANTGLLVSVHQEWNTSANLAVCDVSRKGQVRQIYSFEEVYGLIGFGDATYNLRRNIFGAIGIGGKIAYHLYRFTTSKAGHTVNFIRKYKWYPKCRRNAVPGLDFNPNGETMAILDQDGTCLLSDVTTGKYNLYLNIGMSEGGDPLGRCKWSPHACDPSLFVKYDKRYLNILDAEKKDFTMKTSRQLDKKWTCGIDVCQGNGNLLATGGREGDVKIFDRRESMIIRTFDGIHTDGINCVRWSPSGDMIATAGDDHKVTLLDVKTGKNIYTGATSENEEPKTVCFI